MLSIGMVRIEKVHWVGVITKLKTFRLGGGLTFLLCPLALFVLHLPYGFFVWIRIWRLVGEYCIEGCQIAAFLSKENISHIRGRFLSGKGQGD